MVDKSDSFYNTIYQVLDEPGLTASPAPHYSPRQRLRVELLGKLQISKILLPGRNIKHFFLRASPKKCSALSFEERGDNLRLLPRITDPIFLSPLR